MLFKHPTATTGKRVFKPGYSNDVPSRQFQPSDGALEGMASLATFGGESGSVSQ